MGSIAKRHCYQTLLHKISYQSVMLSLNCLHIKGTAMCSEYLYFLGKCNLWIVTCLLPTTRSISATNRTLSPATTNGPLYVHCISMTIIYMKTLWRAYNCRHMKIYLKKTD